MACQKLYLKGRVWASEPQGPRARPSLRQTQCSGQGAGREKRHVPGQAPAGSGQKPRGLLVTMPPRSTKALEMLLKFRKSSCCCGSDCRALMLSRTRAAACGQVTRGSGPGLARRPPCPPHPPLALGNPNFTSMHQLSQSIFSCWAVEWPSLRDLEALEQSRKGKRCWAVSPPRVPPPTSPAAWAAASPGQDYHHGIEVDCAVCQALQDQLFICQVGGSGSAGESWGGGQGRWGGVVGEWGSLTDDPLLVFYQLGLYHAGELLQGLHCLHREGWRQRSRGPAASALPPPIAVPPPAAYQLSAPIQLRVDEATETQATAQPRPPSRNGESDRLVATPHPGPCPNWPKLTSSAVCLPLLAGDPRSQRGSLERCQVQKVPSLCPVWEEAPTVILLSNLHPPQPPTSPLSSFYHTALQSHKQPENIVSPLEDPENAQITENALHPRFLPQGKPEPQPH